MRNLVHAGVLRVAAMSLIMAVAVAAAVATVASSAPDPERELAVAKATTFAKGHGELNPVLVSAVKGGAKDIQAEGGDVPPRLATATVWIVKLSGTFDDVRGAPPGGGGIVKAASPKPASTHTLILYIQNGEIVGGMGAP